MTAKPDLVELKRFAVQMAVAFPLLFALLFPWLFSYGIPVWPWIVSAVFIGVRLVHAPGLYWPYRAWMSLAHGLGWVNTRLILGLIYFVLIVPLGLLMRLVGKLQYNRDFPGEAGSLYIERREPLDPRRLEDPF